MPITPFHLGPGLAVKAVTGHRFSLMVFGFSQVAIDIEPFVGLIRGASILHGFTHTYVGATLIGLASVVIGRPICELLARHVRRHPYPILLARLPWPERISRPAAIAGAFVGTYSHIVLDGMMHPDMRPLAPWSDATALLGAMSVGSLYLFCVVCGVVGGLVMLVRDRS